MVFNDPVTDRVRSCPHETGDQITMTANPTGKKNFMLFNIISPICLLNMALYFIMNIDFQGGLFKKKMPEYHYYIVN